jgi:hypothetical protein
MGKAAEGLEKNLLGKIRSVLGVPKKTYPHPIYRLFMALYQDTKQLLFSGDDLCDDELIIVIASVGHGFLSCRRIP